MCIYHPHFAIFMHIEPVAEIAYVEQEPDEGLVVVQQPLEEQQHVEEQPGYDYVPEATRELTTDFSEQGRHPMHFNLCKPCQIIVCRLCIKFEELLETHLHIFSSISMSF